MGLHLGLEVGQILAQGPCRLIPDLHLQGATMAESTESDQFDKWFAWSAIFLELFFVFGYANHWSGFFGLFDLVALLGHFLLTVLGLFLGVFFLVLALGLAISLVSCVCGR